MAHEAPDGGHTLRKHVGKSEEFLRHRLATEPDIKAASTFYDRQAAEFGIRWTLEEHAATVSRWLAGNSRSLILEATVPRPVGTVITHAVPEPVYASGVRVLVKRSSAMPTGFRIHTAMVI